MFNRYITIVGYVRHIWPKYIGNSIVSTSVGEYIDPNGNTSDTPTSNYVDGHLHVVDFGGAGKTPFEEYANKMWVINHDEKNQGFFPMP